MIKCHIYIYLKNIWIASYLEIVVFIVVDFRPTPTSHINPCCVFLCNIFYMMELVDLDASNRRGDFNVFTCWRMSCSTQQTASRRSRTFSVIGHTYAIPLSLAFPNFR